MQHSAKQDETVTIAEILSSIFGWTQTEPTETNYYSIFVEGNDTFTHKNFGNYKAAIVDVSVWNDYNRNGVRDSGEPALVSWPVALAFLEDYEEDDYSYYIFAVGTTDVDGVAYISLGSRRFKPDRIYIF
jgi:hypothetical protein